MGGKRFSMISRSLNSCRFDEPVLPSNGGADQKFFKKSVWDVDPTAKKDPTFRSGDFESLKKCCVLFGDLKIYEIECFHTFRAFWGFKNISPPSMMYRPPKNRVTFRGSLQSTRRLRMQYFLSPEKNRREHVFRLPGSMVTGQHCDGILDTKLSQQGLLP